MKKSILIGIFALSAGLIWLGNARAQQSSGSGTQTAPASNASQAPAPKATPKTPAAKTGTSAAAKTPVPLVLKTDKEKNSYALGMNWGRMLHKDSVDVDPALVARGIRDELNGAKTAMTDDEAQKMLSALQAEVKKKAQELREEAGVKNKTEGEAFLASNKTAEGVVTLPSGLQYKVLTEGTGAKPTPTDSVTCNYRGTLLDGTEFDSSYKRGQPATFAVGQVIKGWTEALQLMSVGSKWQLFIPSNLAYGERGAGQDIGPNATLIFEVELLSIKEKPATPPAVKPMAPVAPVTPPAANTSPNPATPPPASTPPPTAGTAPATTTPPTTPTPLTPKQ
jgi:FKBP-type peptidyl-prolyl cis-trans isomerase